MKSRSGNVVEDPCPAGCDASSKRPRKSATHPTKMMRTPQTRNASSVMLGRLRSIAVVESRKPHLVSAVRRFPSRSLLRPRIGPFRASDAGSNPAGSIPISASSYFSLQSSKPVFFDRFIGAQTIAGPTRAKLVPSLPLIKPEAKIPTRMLAFLLCSDKDLIRDGVPSIVNSNQEQHQRCRADEVEGWAHGVQSRVGRDSESCVCRKRKQSMEQPILEHRPVGGLIAHTPGHDDDVHYSTDTQ